MELNFRKFKKSLNLVITTSLIIIVSISLLIAFQIWSESLIKKTQSKASSLLEKPIEINLLSVEDNKNVIYLKTKVSISNVNIKIKSNNKIICDKTVSLNKGVNEVILNCNEEIIPGESYTAIIKVKNNVFKEDVFAS